jgi:hypothetical protein
MIYDDAARIFRDNHWTIKLKDGKMVEPTALDIEQIVNEAVQQLMSKDQQLNQIEVARLIIQKNGLHHDLYIHLGSV